MFDSNKFDPKSIEPKWQRRWLESRVYSPNLGNASRKFYNLMMFPYPSAEGLHAGNMFAFTGSDVYGRYKRMQGFSVFEPIGLDGFGIHSENFALKIGRTPKEHARISEENYYRQLKIIGNSFDWDRTLETYDADYYRWTQWLFIKLFKAGLAYRAKALVNWCPGCRTVISDEQIMSAHQAGKVPPGYKSLKEVPDDVKVCERCGSIPEKKDLEQWFFRITKYADRLVGNLDKINWPAKIKLAQKNWIGRSEGMLIKFKIEGKDHEIEVFTTRPDTLNAATFIAVSRAATTKAEKGNKEKEGKFTGEYAINPLNGRKLPIWETNYVSAEYGTGAIMGVPAHDERDGEFANKYKLEIIDIKPDQTLSETIKKEGWGRSHTNYHLRDWLISRQRYWGPPIPMIYCKKCAEKGECYWSKENLACPANWNSTGWYPTPEDDLPVTLPDIPDYAPEGTGRGPLAAHPEFYKVKCPGCGAEAKRETDVSDTFLDSSWYFLRYPSVGSKTEELSAFDPEITKDWLPVDQYFGGAEHALLHLMYARFITMTLFDLKLVDFEEPFTNFYAHGLVIKDGAKMSKSKGNVVNPDEYIAKYGADTLRLYLMFMGPMDSYMDFRDSGIEGMRRFVERVWKLINSKPKEKIEDDQVVKLHQTIKKVTEDVENFRYNTAISAIMELVSDLKAKGTDKESLKVLSKLIAPLAPHLAEEAWEILGEEFSIHTSGWPKFEARKLEEDETTLIIQVDGKVRGQMTIDREIATDRDKVEKGATGKDVIQKWLENKKYEVIFVPGKIINFVTKQ